MKVMVWFQIAVIFLAIAAILAVKNVANPPYPDWWLGPAAVIVVFVLLVLIGPYVAYLGAKHGREARRRRMNANR
jgi:membrane protein YdbS with pleckstrin-like domain